MLLVFLLLLAALFFVPSPEMGQSLLSMGPVKSKLLRATPSPKIILVGGSNISHGLNSQKIHEAMGLPVVNMGLHGGLGLRFMLEEVRPAINRYDLVVIVPEYAQFQKGGFWGNKEVLGMVLDVMPESRHLLSPQHWIHLFKFMPNYAARKIMNACTGFIRRRRITKRIEYSYNSYGDSIGHWNKKPSPFTPVKKAIKSQISKYSFDHLEFFVRETQQKGAKTFILPPCFQATSYDNCALLIDQIEQQLLKRQMPLLVPMKRYRMEDHLFHDTPYHLTKQGAELRTDRLIEDLKKAEEKVNL
jgi:hypothetical protein